MSFEVNTTSLRNFAEFLEGYEEDARAVDDFICSETCDMRDYQEGLIAYLAGSYTDDVDGMRERTKLMAEIAEGSTEGLNDVAGKYDEMDAEAAADFDATLDKVPSDEHQGTLTDSYSGGFGESEPTEYDFQYENVAGELKVKKDAAGLEPKASTVEEWYRGVTGYISATSRVTGIMNLAFGWDPVTWIVELFHGEWQLYAECALMWECCESALAGMSENFTTPLVLLESVWQGRAGDDASRYFYDVQTATATEAEAYAVLYEIYKLNVEYVHESQQLLKDQIGAAIDLAVGILLAMAAGVTGPVTGVAAVVELIDALIMTLTCAIDYAKLIETYIAGMQLPEVPECEFMNLPAPTEFDDETPVYQGPEFPASEGPPGGNDAPEPESPGEPAPASSDPQPA